MQISTSNRLNYIVTKCPEVIKKSHGVIKKSCGVIAKLDLISQTQ